MTHMMIPHQRAIACGENYRNVPSTRAEAVVSCQRCIAWIAGREDGRDGTSFGMTYDNDPESPRSVAYDNGRTFGESGRKTARARA